MAPASGRAGDDVPAAPAPEPPAVPAGAPAVSAGPQAVSGSRGQLTRRRIAEAALVLMEERDAPPTGRDIAERAGVSLRLVFHHFKDLDALHGMVIDLYAQRYGHLAPSVPSDLPLPTRVQRTVERRAALYESIGNLGRNAAALAPIYAAIAGGRAATRELMSSFLECTFAPELDAAGPRRRELLAALNVAGSWEAWDRLRSGDGRSVAFSRGVIARLFRALLGSESGSGSGSESRPPDIELA